MLVLSRLTHRFEDYQNFGNITETTQADAAADYLNALVPESVVLVADTEITTFSSKLEYALQRCGAQLLTSDSPNGPYALVGIVRDYDAEDTREALDEGWEEVVVELEASLPHLYSPAPISRKGPKGSKGYRCEMRDIERWDTKKYNRYKRRWHRRLWRHRQHSALMKEEVFTC